MLNFAGCLLTCIVTQRWCSTFLWQAFVFFASPFLSYGFPCCYISWQSEWLWKIWPFLDLVDCFTTCQVACFCRASFAGNTAIVNLLPLCTIAQTLWNHYASHTKKELNSWRRTHIPPLLTNHLHIYIQKLSNVGNQHSFLSTTWSYWFFFSRQPQPPTHRSSHPVLIMTANTRLAQSYCDTRCNNPICNFLFFFAQVLENHQLPSSIYLQRKSVNNSKPSDSKHPYILSLVVGVVIITFVRVLRVGTWCWNEPRDARFLCMGVKTHSQQLSFVH